MVSSHSEVILAVEIPFLCVRRKRHPKGRDRSEADSRLEKFAQTGPVPALIQHEM
jgi:hypothetical protein